MTSGRFGYLKLRLEKYVCFIVRGRAHPCACVFVPCSALATSLTLLVGRCVLQAVKATSRKKRSVDPKNYAWTGLNQFLSTIGLGHDASENPHHQTNAAKPDSAAASSVAPPTKRAKTDSKGASQAAESRSSLKSWCTQGQVALLNFYRSVLVANTDTDAVEATKQKKSNTPRAFLDLNKVLDVTNALSGTTQKDGHAREWKLEIGSGSGEWAAKQVCLFTHFLRAGGVGF